MDGRVAVRMAAKSRGTNGSRRRRGGIGSPKVRPYRAAGHRRAVSSGQIRLWSGLVLFGFVACHLVNVAFGVVSAGAQNAASTWLLGPWQTDAGLLVLGAAVCLHVGVNLRALHRRRTLRLRPWEAAQYLSGFLVPPLLMAHAVGTVPVSEVYGVDPDYQLVLGAFWVGDPWSGVRQATLLIVAWTHGSIGLWHWLKLKTWFATARPLLQAAAVLVPALALAGYVSAGTEIRRVAATDPDFLQSVQDKAGVSAESAAASARWTTIGLTAYWGLLAAVLGARALRNARTRIKGQRVVYGEGRVVPLIPGATLLETLRAAGIPHPSVCGGRGRCTTCRVLVRDGLADLLPPVPIEQAALTRIQAPEQVRLACQIRPTGNLSVAPLLSPHATAADGRKPGHLLGHEQIVTVAFIDLRGSTGLGEVRMPFDTLFILNLFFAEMMTALRETGGHYSNFTGDGLMALYGLDGDPAEAARRALAGGQAMLERLADLNERLAADLPQPLRIGVGIHSGEAIVGEMGPPDARTISAIGDTVNLAARLEGLSKEIGHPIVVSRDTIRLGRIRLPGVRPMSRTVRGRQEPIAVYGLDRVPDDL